MRTNYLALSSLAIFCCAVFSAIGAPVEPSTNERAKHGVAAHYLKAEEEKLEKIKQMLEEQLPKMSPKGKQIATKFVEILLNKKLTYEEFRKEILKLDNETDAKTNDEFANPVLFELTPAQSPCQFGHVQSRLVCAPTPAQSPCQFGHVQSRLVCANSGPVPMPIWPCSVPFSLCQLRPSPHANLALFSPVLFELTPAQSPCQFGPVHPVLFELTPAQSPCQFGPVQSRFV
ncbi:hypothetical protein niasHT_000452 [Heterodera trifolii]|uniref:Effector protein n=1 Tax=Heterodera trifolii TaxID=157864 RepID=A0ABD2M480_9BILA